MPNYDKAIADLIRADGKTSAQMTHALKFIGDGDMQRGISRLADYFTKVGKKAGTMKGVIGGGIGGAAVTSLLFGVAILIKNKIEKDKEHEAEGKAILQDIEEGYQLNENNG